MLLVGDRRCKSTRVSVPPSNDRPDGSLTQRPRVGRRFQPRDLGVAPSPPDALSRQLPSSSGIAKRPPMPPVPRPAYVCDVDAKPAWRGSP